MPAFVFWCAFILQEISRKFIAVSICPLHTCPWRGNLSGNSETEKYPGPSEMAQGMFTEWERGGTQSHIGSIFSSGRGHQNPINHSTQTANAEGTHNCLSPHLLCTKRWEIVSKAKRGIKKQWQLVHFTAHGIDHFLSQSSKWSAVHWSSSLASCHTPSMSCPSPKAVYQPLCLLCQ